MRLARRPLDPRRAYGAAAALGLGGLFWMIAELIHPDGTGTDQMQWMTAHPMLSGRAPARRGPSGS